MSLNIFLASFSDISLVGLLSFFLYSLLPNILPNTTANMNTSRQGHFHCNGMLIPLRIESENSVTMNIPNITINIATMSATRFERAVAGSTGFSSPIPLARFSLLSLLAFRHFFNHCLEVKIHKAVPPINGRTPKTIIKIAYCNDDMSGSGAVVMSMSRAINAQKPKKLSIAPIVNNTYFFISSDNFYIITFELENTKLEWCRRD